VVVGVVVAGGWEGALAGEVVAGVSGILVVVVLGIGAAGVGLTVAAWELDEIPNPSARPATTRVAMTPMMNPGRLITRLCTGHTAGEFIGRHREIRDGHKLFGPSVRMHGSDPPGPTVALP
jgi:hypothetical protein